MDQVQLKLPEDNKKIVKENSANQEIDKNEDKMGIDNKIEHGTEKGDTDENKIKKEDTDKDKTDKGDTGENKMDKGDTGENKTDKVVTDETKTDQGDTGETKTDKGDTCENKMDKGNTGENKQDEGDTCKNKMDKGDTDEDKQDKGDAGENKTDKEVAGKNKTDKDNTCDKKTTKGDAGKNKTNEGVTSKNKTNEKITGKNKTNEGVTDKGKKVEKENTTDNVVRIGTEIDTYEDDDNDNSYPKKFIEGSGSFSDSESFLNRIFKSHKQRILTDFTIVARGQSFLVHKLVLISACPFFDRLIHSESTTDFMVLNDLEPDILNSFFTLLYTGTTDFVNFSEVDLKTLLYVGNKFECLNFDHIVLSGLLCNLNANNYAVTLLLSQKLQEQIAMDSVLNFIAQSLEYLRVRTDFCTCLSEATLKSIMYIAAEIYQCHEVLLQAILSWVEYLPMVRTPSLLNLLECLDAKMITETYALNKLNEQGLHNIVKRLLLEAIKPDKHKEDKDSPKSVTSSCNSLSKLSVKEGNSTFTLSFISKPLPTPVLLFLGRDETNSLSFVFYLIHQDQWTKFTDTGLSIETKPGICFHDDNVYVVGGISINGIVSNKSYVYSLDKRRSIELDDLRVSRFSPVVFATSKGVYVAGGVGRYAKRGLSHVEYLENPDATWKVASAMKINRDVGVVACTIKDMTYVTGGSTCRCECFNSKNNIWNTIASLPGNEMDDFHNPSFASHNDELHAFKLYKPTSMQVYNSDNNIWTVRHLKGRPPQELTHTTGIDGSIYAVDKEMKLHKIDMKTLTWTSICKVPRNMGHVAYFCGLSEDQWEQTQSNI